MAPQTVAVVGASTRERAMGNTVLRNFHQMDFQGTLYGVHPRESKVEGVDCYPSIGDLPTPPDVAVIALRRELVLDALLEAGEVGTKAAVVFASGLGETANGTQLAAELEEIASSYEMSITGPNCMGLVNVTNQTSLYSSALPPVMKPGAVALVSQSGSGCIAMICCGRLEFSFIVSAGNELVTTAADYLEYFVEDPATRVIAMILETIRDPERFAAGARKARFAGKPVIVLKAGRSKRGQQAAAAHTGALIAPSDEYEAFFRKHGIIQVPYFDELIETAVLLGSAKRSITGRRIGFVSLSGGENALLLDGSTDLDFEFPEFSEATRRQLREALPDFASISNPLDATGTAVFDKKMYRAALEAVESDSSVDLVGVIQDAPPALDPSHQNSVAASLRVVAEVADVSSKPFAVLSNIGGSVHPSSREALSAADVPILTGTREGLLAINHFLDWSASRTPEAVEPPQSGKDSTVPWSDSNSLGTSDAFNLIESYDIQIARQRFVRSTGEAIKAKDELGYPVAVKAASGQILHKTELGLVHLGIKSDEELAEAIGAIQEELGDKPNMVVQEMVSGLEVILGARTSPTFGPVVLLGAGGVLVELLRDTATGIAPLNTQEVEWMIAETALGDLLAGFRGGPHLDVQGLTKAVCNFSQLAWDLRSELDEMEINPLIVLPAGRGVKAVDVVVTRKDD